MSTLQPLCTACYDFTMNGARWKKSIVVKPGIIRQLGDEQRVSWFCSRGFCCEDEYCEHSKMTKPYNREGRVEIGKAGWG